MTVDWLNRAVSGQPRCTGLFNIIAVRSVSGVQCFQGPGRLRECCCLWLGLVCMRAEGLVLCPSPPPPLTARLFWCRDTRCSTNGRASVTVAPYLRATLGRHLGGDFCLTYYDAFLHCIRIWLRAGVGRRLDALSSWYMATNFCCLMVRPLHFVFL